MNKLELQRKIFKELEESRMREGLGEKKYRYYERLALAGKLDDIPDMEMHKDYCNPSGRLGRHYAENLLNPRIYFMNRISKS